MFYDISQIADKIRNATPDNMLETNLFHFLSFAKEQLLKNGVPFTHIQIMLSAMTIQIESVEISDEKMTDLVDAYVQFMVKIYNMYNTLGLVNEHSISNIFRDVSLELS